MRGSSIPAASSRTSSMRIRSSLRRTRRARRTAGGRDAGPRAGAPCGRARTIPAPVAFTEALKSRRLTRGRRAAAQRRPEIEQVALRWRHPPLGTQRLEGAPAAPRDQDLRQREPHPFRGVRRLRTVRLRASQAYCSIDDPLVGMIVRRWRKSPLERPIRGDVTHFRERIEQPLRTKCCGRFVVDTSVSPTLAWPP